MNSFSEIDNNFEHFRREFVSILNDSFGKRMNENEFEEFSKNIKLLILQEERIKTESMNIKRLLIEAESIIPMIGF